MYIAEYQPIETSEGWGFTTDYVGALQVVLTDNNVPDDPTFAAMCQNVYGLRCYPKLMEGTTFLVQKGGKNIITELFNTSILLDKSGGQISSPS